MRRDKIKIFSGIPPPDHLSTTFSNSYIHTNTMSSSKRRKVEVDVSDSEGGSEVSSSRSPSPSASNAKTKQADVTTAAEEIEDAPKTFKELVRPIKRTTAKSYSCLLRALSIHYATHVQHWATKLRHQFRQSRYRWRSRAEI
jgi:hypothetical protein